MMRESISLWIVFVPDIIFTTFDENGINISTNVHLLSRTNSFKISLTIIRLFQSGNDEFWEVTEGCLDSYE